jgi:hypothetical protein
MKRRSHRVLQQDADRIVDRKSFAVAFAMFQARPKVKAPAPRIKPKLGPVEFAARFAIEKALQQRRYCNAFALWRTCRDKNCRRQGACHGDAHACLRHSLATVPRHVQMQAQRDILKATPDNIGAPERKARQCLPLELCTEGDD